MNQNESNHLATAGHAPAAASHNSGGVATGRRLLIVAIVLGLLIAVGIFRGIHSRVEAQANLHQTALESATPAVDIVHPATGADAEEVELPGNTQAFNDTPIFVGSSII